MKTALITGITGQDGSYLSEFLLKKGYKIFGLIRRSSLFNRSRIEKIINSNPQKFELLYSDLGDSSSLNRILEKTKPDEIYNLGAQSHVQISFEIPEYTSDINALGTLRILDAIRDTKIETKFYQASSSELFGKVEESPQTEETKFHPRSPYACSKAYAFYITQNYREAYDIFACNGILFNHESPRRGENFVTRKITLSLSKIKLGMQDVLVLGNLDAKRDWGFAGDFVKAMWLMMQQNRADDYVIATNETHTVREFIEIASSMIGFNIIWEGVGLDEVGKDSYTGQVIIRLSDKYFRPSEVDLLLGDYTKAKNNLGWEPKVSFEELISKMVKSDMEYIKRLK
jgi:GDPmannose 4,6-dehydratase